MGDFGTDVLGCHCQYAPLCQMVKQYVKPPSSIYDVRIGFCNFPKVTGWPAYPFPAQYTIICINVPFKERFPRKCVPLSPFEKPSCLSPLYDSRLFTPPCDSSERQQTLLPSDTVRQHSLNLLRMREEHSSLQ